MGLVDLNFMNIKGDFSEVMNILIFLCEIRYNFFWMLDISGSCKFIFFEKGVFVFVKSGLVGGKGLSIVDLDFSDCSDKIIFYVFSLK